MRGKRKAELIVLQQKATAYDILIQTLNAAEVRVLLNNMPLMICDISHLLVLMDMNGGEVELVKTRGNANVDARIISKKEIWK